MNKAKIPAHIYSKTLYPFISDIFLPLPAEKTICYSQFCTHVFYAFSVGVILTILSVPQSLHLIGRSFIRVVGNNHKTVCLQHTGQRNRLRTALLSLICDLSCKVSCKRPSPHFSTFAAEENKKARTTIVNNDRWHRL